MRELAIELVQLDQAEPDVRIVLKQAINLRVALLIRVAQALTLTS